MMSRELERTACPACASTRISAAYPLDATPASGSTYTVTRCASCGFEFLAPLPSADDIHASMNVEYFDAYVEPGVRAAKIRNLERLLKHVDMGQVSRVLEVGCADGFLTEHLLDRGFDALGVERDVSVAERAVDRIGRPAVLQGDFQEMEFDAPFDLILMLDVLEHVPEPRRFLQHAADYLASPQAQIVVLTPNAGSALHRIMGRHWLGYYIEHCSYLTRASMEVLAARCGLELAGARPFFKLVTVSYFARTVAIRFPKAEVVGRLRGSTLGDVRVPVYDDSIVFSLRQMASSSAGSTSS